MKSLPTVAALLFGLASGPLTNAQVVTYLEAMAHNVTIATGSSVTLIRQMARRSRSSLRAPSLTRARQTKTIA